MFDEPADGETVTAANPGFSRAGPHSCLRPPRLATIEVNNNDTQRHEH